MLKQCRESKAAEFVRLEPGTEDGLCHGEQVITNCTSFSSPREIRLNPIAMASPVRGAQIFTMLGAVDEWNPHLIPTLPLGGFTRDQDGARRWTLLVPRDFPRTGGRSWPRSALARASVRLAAVRRGALHPRGGGCARLAWACA